MSNNTSLKLESADISNFNPELLEKGQEIIFTLKDSNILDTVSPNVPPSLSIKDNFQIDEINYDKNTGIVIERPNENEILNQKKEKLEIELKDDGQIIDENILLNKFNKIKNKIKKENFNENKKKFQNEFYNEDELKLLNKKKNRKNKNNMIIFDIDINEEKNIEENNTNDEGEINNKDINDKIKDKKKKLFTQEDKEKLEKMFNKKDKDDFKAKKNIININVEENNKLNEETNNNNNTNIDNLNIKSNDKNYKIIDEYEIFLNNLPTLNNYTSESKKINLPLNQSDIPQNIINNNNNEELQKEQILKEQENEESTINAREEKEDDEIPLITDEPIIGKGVCVALQIFKNKKMLKNEEEEFGRYHDKKYKNITNENEEKKSKYDNNILNIKDKDEYYKHKEINIEYRDENGRKLKPKEMARYQALIFHGEKSSVRKREKKLLREKYQVFVQNPNNNKTLNYMNFMKDKNNQAFATLQGKSSFL